MLDTNQMANLRQSRLWVSRMQPSGRGIPYVPWTHRELSFVLA